MPRKTIVSDSYIFDALVFDKYREGATNAKDRRRMLELVYRAMKEELTDYQFYCLKEHYVYGRKMKDIAAERGVHPSSVTRTIRRSRDKVSRITHYYFG